MKLCFSITIYHQHVAYVLKVWQHCTDRFSVSSTTRNVDTHVATHINYWSALTGLREHMKEILRGTAIVDPSIADPSLVDPSLVDPSIVDPSIVDPSVYCSDIDGTSSEFC